MQDTFIKKAFTKNVLKPKNWFDSKTDGKTSFSFTAL
jgi:hypothetical protein